MSKINNGGLDQYDPEPFEQQQFGTAGVEWVKYDVHFKSYKQFRSEMIYARFILASALSNSCPAFCRYELPGAVSASEQLSEVRLSGGGFMVYIIKMVFCLTSELMFGCMRRQRALYSAVSIRPLRVIGAWGIKFHSYCPVDAPATLSK